MPVIVADPGSFPSSMFVKSPPGGGVATGRRRRARRAIPVVHLRQAR
ncbi:MAG: hypothetical protein ACRDQ7_23390 [Haloechinothrix sp.]